MQLHLGQKLSGQLPLPSQKMHWREKQHCQIPDDRQDKLDLLYLISTQISHFYWHSQFVYGLAGGDVDHYHP